MGLTPCSGGKVVAGPCAQACYPGWKEWLCEPAAAAQGCACILAADGAQWNDVLHQWNVTGNPTAMQTPQDCFYPLPSQALASCALLLHPQNHDRRPAATALQHTWQQLQRQQQQQDHQQHLSSRLGGLYSSSEDQQEATAAAAPGQQQQQQLISQAKLSQLLQQQLGYSLAVRPSDIQHQDAGR